MSEHAHFKDETLNRLSDEGHNIAQFVSHSPEGNQRFSRTLGRQANYKYASIHDAVSSMLARTTEHSINIRSYDLFDSKSKPFYYGITSTDEAIDRVARLHDQGLHTIINETVNIDDGGVSGVAIGNVIEFAPHDTPRCVEKPGTVQLARSMGMSVLRNIYGFAPELPLNPDLRVEFSVHPLRHGYQDKHTIIWETEQVNNIPEVADTTWPNRMSDMIGDKTFGLLIAEQIGLKVPRTTAINRTIKPFTFGEPTGNAETWLRTAPNKQTPGLYTTTHGWIDPYELLHNEDPSGDAIASILSQESVEARYSGACIMGADDELIIEGRAGSGERFMVGEHNVEKLPVYVVNRIKDTYRYARDQLGDVRFEWVFDGIDVWIVQLHKGKSTSIASVIYPGQPDTAYAHYSTNDGIEGLRRLIAQHSEGEGIILDGNVGVTSHFGDLLRKARIPSMIVRTQD